MQREGCRLFKGMGVRQKKPILEGRMTQKMTIFKAKNYILRLFLRQKRFSRKLREIFLKKLFLRMQKSRLEGDQVPSSKQLSIMLQLFEISFSAGIIK